MPDYVSLIRENGLTIYDPLTVDSPLYIPTPELEAILNAGLHGICTEGLPNKTRSKVVKSAICELLGYPVPKRFKKTKPRFFGQNFDAITQKSNNVQPWNEPIDPLRRYALIRQKDGILTCVRVVTGESLVLLDRTGTLTGKYQARLNLRADLSELIAEEDTAPMLPLVGNEAGKCSPVAYPKSGRIFPIRVIYERLCPLIGRSFPDPGVDQERNRGAALHRLVCEELGYSDYADDGRFPDIKSEVLEIKLQTSPTIDLGLVTPDSTSPVDIPPINGTQLRHCDCRYAIFDAETDGTTVTIRRVYVTTGEAFFTRFPRFEGNVINTKRQIRLPSDFFGG